MKCAQLLMFWDYDTQWGADRSRAGAGPRVWGELDFENTETLLQVHETYRVPACFAVVGAAALPGKRPYHDPAQVRRIHSAGHEIASHGFRHEWLPGLGRTELRTVLRDSKAALEDCIGAAIRCFVPPYNQPYDHPQRFAFSIAERREAGRTRTHLGTLCEELGSSGFQFCRVAYRPFPVQIFERLTGKRLDVPMPLTTIGSITCARLNTACGFDSTAVSVLRRAVKTGGVVVVYGHPHSLRSEGRQAMEHLIPFLEEVGALRRAGALDVCLPSQLIN